MEPELFTALMTTAFVFAAALAIFVGRAMAWRMEDEWCRVIGGAALFAGYFALLFGVLHLRTYAVFAGLVIGVVGTTLIGSSTRR